MSGIYLDKRRRFHKMAHRYCDFSGARGIEQLVIILARFFNAIPTGLKIYGGIKRSKCKANPNSVNYLNGI